MKAVWTWIRHNQAIAVSMIIVTGLMIYTFGCESKVTSLLDDAKMVTAAELQLEIDVIGNRLESELDTLIKRGKLKFEELARKDEIKQKLLDLALITKDAGKINPAGIVGLIFSIVGIGAGIDNRLKDKVIKNRPLMKTEV